MRMKATLARPTLGSARAIWSIGPFRNSSTSTKPLSTTGSVVRNAAQPRISAINRKNMAEPNEVASTKTLMARLLTLRMLSTMRSIWPPNMRVRRSRCMRSSLAPSLIAW
ncbi:hypothetical protein D9M72_314380 [compost metagenome]